MRAAFYTRQGAAHDVLQVGELPTPDPGPGEVRVKLRTSGVNPSDWKIRRGGFGRGMAAPLVVPHSDGAGTIDAVGTGVSDRRSERVWIWNGQWKRALGTAAEYIVLPESQAVYLPDHVTFAAGACLGIPAMTALHAITLAGVREGSTVLITGGAGAVAHYAIQIAKIRGARVISTVSSDEKEEHARDAGADAIVNYKTENIGERIQEWTGGAGVDVLIDLDLSGNAEHYPKLLRQNATIVVYGTSANEATIPSLWLMQNSVQIKFFLVYSVDGADRKVETEVLTNLLERRQLKHRIARELPLESIADAHELLEKGQVIGNVVLDIV